MFLVLEAIWPLRIAITIFNVDNYIAFTWCHAPMVSPSTPDQWTGCALTRPADFFQAWVQVLLGLLG